VSRKLTRSRELQKRAERFIPAGVNSPVRAFKAVGGDAPMIVRGAGSHIFDVDGNDYIDYVGSWGPLILGHAHPKVVAAIEEAARNGASFGASTPAEGELAALVQKAFPSMQMMRFVSSGTEATMSALRVARAFTNRKHIVKFEGCYHGHADALLVKGGSGLATFGMPGSAGVPEESTKFTIALPFNDNAAIEKAFKKVPDKVAAVIIEPVVGNMGCVPPSPGYLKLLRDLCTKNGALLIFDEVMTGFRVAFGGAQQLYRIKPDLTCLGKIIGGGLPVGAYGGRREIMRMVAPLGPVYQAGTLSGNPLAMAAGIATVSELNNNRDIYDKLEYNAETLCKGVAEAAKSAGVPLTINRVGSMFTFFFTDKNVRDWTSAERSDTKKFAKFHRAVLDSGVYLPPSQFEAAFLSAAHTADDVNATIELCAGAAKAALK
jgi:glutamate-1-semialdehyde 2,1-aminomutase